MLCTENQLRAIEGACYGATGPASTENAQQWRYSRVNYTLNHHCSPIKVAQWIGKSGSAIPNMALSTIYFDPLSPLSPQIPKFFITNKLSSFLLETHCSRHHGIDAHCDKIFTQLGYGIRLPKTTLRAKINWVWARGACKNLGPPTVEASNFKIWYTTWTWG